MFGCGDLTILLLGLAFHCFVIENRKSLCHSLGRPSRSDFVQSQFIGSDYGAKEGCPTKYYINGVEITDLLGEERVVYLPYGIYKIEAPGYHGRLENRAADGQTFKGRHLSVQ